MVSSIGAMRDAVARAARSASYLMFCPILRSDASSSSGFSASSASLRGIWPGSSPPPPNRSPVALRVAERHVAGLARRDGQREADEIGAASHRGSSSRCRRRSGRPRGSARASAARRSSVVTVSYFVRSIGVCARGARETCDARRRACRRRRCLPLAGEVPRGAERAEPRVRSARRMPPHGARATLAGRRRRRRRAPRRCAASAC